MKILNSSLLKEFAKKKNCELCFDKYVLHTHHEPPWGSAGLETRLTLIRLCIDCHTHRHAGAAFRTEQAIVAAICTREKCSEGDREAVVFLLKRSPKDSGREWFFAESLLWATSAIALLDKTLTEAGL